MTMDLTPVEVRVVGSLLEKEVTTPDTYPLTLNALVAACNQSTGRAPDLGDKPVGGGSIHPPATSG